MTLYRARQKKVTHHGSPEAVAGDVLAAAETTAEDVGSSLLPGSVDGAATRIRCH